MMKFGQTENERIILQQAYTKKKKKIKKYLSARRKMIPDGSLEMQKETKNNGNGKYVGKPKWLSIA